jgi:esterase/lipase
MAQAQRTCVDDDVTDLAGYRDCEASLQSEADAELAERVSRWPALSRFDPDSPSWARGLQPDWNRTVELPVEQPVGGALLLHGLSDSPYSLHAVAEMLHKAGYYVIAPRMPGHGLHPGALTAVRWQHWRRVTALAARELQQRVGAEAPLVVVGYSNGAALAIDHVLQAIGRDDPAAIPDRIVLLSPAMAVTKFAALGGLVDQLGRIPGFGSLAWNSVVPEFDPVKYNSFPVRAGYEIHGLIGQVEKTMETLARDGRLAQFPPLLTLQSIADNTVPPLTSLTRLYDRVHDAHSQLVLFDINRLAELQDFIVPRGDRLLSLAQADREFDFEVTLVTNTVVDGVTTSKVEALTRPAGTLQFTREPLDMEWPAGVYSLSHVAIPFAWDDPVYGTGETGGLGIGGLAVKGEQGLLSVPPALLARLRYNPFHSYLEQRILEFLPP